MTAARILRLSLRNFRSYRTMQITLNGGPVVLVGHNGAGKTNLLEAISFLAPGRGLRRATLDEVAFSEADENIDDNPADSAETPDTPAWAISAEIEGALGLTTIGTGIEPAGDTALTRRCRIDREPVTSAAAFADHLRIIWLVPAMDGLFTGPASERRRFIDRLVLAVDASHGARVNALERSLRSRNRLLEQPRPDPHWLDAVEHETAEVAVAVAAARVETVQRLAGALIRNKDPGSPFPWAGIALDGWIERALSDTAATEIEDRYRGVLRDNRGRDAAAGRTLDGPHLSDLMVKHGPKGIAADQASTGEQKALLIGLMLAHAGLIAEMTGFAPILLLDEVVAHLDPIRRAALYQALEALGAQVWMTGADPAAFTELAGRAEIFSVTPGRAERLTSSSAS